MAEQNGTTKLPTFQPRETRHTGPADLDYDRGEFWIHGTASDGKNVSAPFMRQRDDESLADFIARVKAVEATIGDQHVA